MSPLIGEFGLRPGRCGRLKFEFEDPGLPNRLLGVGDVLTLPARTRCRAYSWPRHAGQPAVLVAAYPASLAS